MRHNTSRTLAEIDTFDLTLEKRGRRTDITPERREATAAFAEAEGYARVARRLREENARRYGYGEPSLEVVPDDARRPLKGNSNRAILVLHDGAGEQADPTAALWDDLDRVCRRHHGQPISPLAEAALAALRQLIPRRD